MDFKTAEKVLREAAGTDDRLDVDHAYEVAAAAPADVQVEALLHDVLEDTSWTVADLRDRGLTLDQAVVLSLLNREDHRDVTYMNWIRRIAEYDANDHGRRARQVKLADNQVNLNRPATEPHHEEMKERRYGRANRILVAAMRERGELPD